MHLRADHDDALESRPGRNAHSGRQWSLASTIAERANLLRKVEVLHGERREMLAENMVREMSKPVDEAFDEVDYCAAIYDYYADNAEEFLADEPIELADGEGSALIRRVSVGPLLGIMPWNFPCYQVARFAAPNLVAGNTVLLEHAPQCPESAAVLDQLFHDAGYPDGAYVNVYATNEQVEQIIADARIRGISDRIGARRSRCGGDRWAQSEESCARTGWFRSVHFAQHR